MGVTKNTREEKRGIPEGRKLSGTKDYKKLIWNMLTRIDEKTARDAYYLLVGFITEATIQEKRDHE